MKVKLKNILFILVLLFTFSFGEVVKAAETCTTYRDYYFFNLIESETSFNNLTTSNKDWSITNNTYFKAVPTMYAATYTRKDFIHGKVCLHKTNECANWTGVKMSLTEFYDKYVAALKSNNSESIHINGGGTTTNVNHYEETDTATNTVTKYYIHGLWTDLDKDGKDIRHDGTVDVKDVNINELVEGSFLPKISNVTITMLYDQSKDNGYESLRAMIVRQMSAEDLSKLNTDIIKPFNVEWSNEDTNSVLSPALYYDEYKLCTVSADPDMYNATIRYLYKGSNKTAAPTYSKAFADGLGETVKSPPVSGCSADTSSVSFKINGKDFSKTVYYTCDVANNAKTGNIIFIVSMIIAAACFGYVLYYVFVIRKKNME